MQNHFLNYDYAFKNEILESVALLHKTSPSLQGLKESQSLQERRLHLRHPVPRVPS